MVLYKGKTMKDYFLKPITSLAEAGEFFTSLARDGLLFHCEDDPGTVVGNAGYALFKPDEVTALRERIKEVYQFDPDPCAFCNELDADKNEAPGNTIVFGAQETADKTRRRLQALHVAEQGSKSFAEWLALTADDYGPHHDSARALLEWDNRQAGLPPPPAVSWKSGYPTAPNTLPNDQETCPCGLCGKLTTMTGTQRCDECWELESAIKGRPVVAAQVAFEAMTDEQRLSVMRNYCEGCGCVQPKDRPCQCRNDE